MNFGNSPYPFGDPRNTFPPAPSAPTQGQPYPGPQMAQQQPQANPYAQYGYLSQGQQSPDSRREQVAGQIAQSIMAQPAQNTAQGIGQVAAGIGMGLANYRKEGQAFPTAPGGASPSIGTSIANFFTGRHNGGLF